MKTNCYLLCLLFGCLILATTSHAQNYVWAKSFGSDVMLGIISYDIAVDEARNVFVTGYFDGSVDFDPGAGNATLTSAGSWDIFLAKYDAEGNYLWAKRYGTPMSDIGYSVEIDRSGNIYLAGYYGDLIDMDPGAGEHNLPFSGSEDAFIAKYDNNGNYIWAIGFGATGLESIYTMVLDGSGNVYVGGNFEKIVDFDPGPGEATLSVSGGPQASELFFAKFDATGKYVWARQINTYEHPSIAVDLNGNTHLTGTFRGSIDFDPGSGVSILSGPVNGGIFYAKYNENGHYIYAYNMGSPMSCYGRGITTDPAGNVYLSGVFSGTVDFDPGASVANMTSVWPHDVYFAKYDANGKYIWSKSFASDATAPFGQSIRLDNSSNVHLVGSFSIPSDFDPGAGVAKLTTFGNIDVYLAKYDNNGNYLSAKNIGTKHGDSFGTSLAVDASGSIYVTGSFSDSIDFDPSDGVAIHTTSNPFRQNAYVAKYSFTPNSVEESSVHSSPLHIYPNPNNGMMTIVANESFTGGTITISNVFGELVGTWTIEKGSSNSLKLDVSPGVYGVMARRGVAESYQMIVVE